MEVVHILEKSNHKVNGPSSYILCCCSSRKKGMGYFPLDDIEGKREKYSIGISCELNLMQFAACARKITIG